LSIGRVSWSGGRAWWLAHAAWPHMHTVMSNASVTAPSAALRQYSLQ